MDDGLATIAMPPLDEEYPTLAAAPLDEVTTSVLSVRVDEAETRVVSRMEPVATVVGRVQVEGDRIVAIHRGLPPEALEPEKPVQPMPMRDIESAPASTVADPVLRAKPLESAPAGAITVHQPIDEDAAFSSGKAWTEAQLLESATSTVGRVSPPSNALDRATSSARSPAVQVTEGRSRAPEGRRRPPSLRSARRAWIMAVGLLAAGTGVTSGAIFMRLRAPAAQEVVYSPPAVSSSRPQPERLEPEPPSPTVAPPTNEDVRAAADALLDGRREEARELYRGLRQRHPDQIAYAIIENALTRDPALDGLEERQ